MSIKIGDFGLAAKVDKSKTRHTLCGTPTSMAPEIVDKVGHSFEVDIWAFGVMVYYLKYGFAPFSSAQKEQVYKKISKCEYIIPTHVRTTNELSILIKSSLKKEVSSRPTAKMLIEYDFFAPNRVPIKLPVEALTQDINCNTLEFGGNGIYELYSTHDDKNDAIGKIKELLEIISKHQTRQPTYITDGHDYNKIIDIIFK